MTKSAKTGSRKRSRENPASRIEGRKSSERKGPWLFAIFAFALLVRLAVLQPLLELPLHRTSQLDSLEYRIRAERIRAGDFAAPAIPAHGPGYPFFLGGLLYAFGGSLTAVGVVQSLLGAAVCVFVTLLGWMWFGKRPGIFAGLLQAVNGPSVLIGASILAEGLLLFLLVLALWCFERARAGGNRRTFLAGAAVTGALIGLSGLVRPTALVLLPVVILVAVFRPPMGVARAGAGGIVAAAALTAAALVVLAPVAMQSWRHSRSFFLVQGHGGLNFYLGNSPLGRGVASGRFGGSWDAIAGDALRHGVTRPSNQDRYYVRKAAREIRDSPSRYAALLGSKTLRTFQNEEVRDSHSYYFFTDRIPLLSWFPGFGVVLSLAVCGILIAVRDRRLPLLAVGYLVAFSATCVFLVVGARYRLPLVPILAVLAGAGLSGLFAAFANRKWKQAVALSVILLASFAFTHLLADPLSHDLAEEWYFTGNSLADEQDLSGAEAAYRRALEIHPGFAPSFEGLGVLSVKRGDWASAEQSFEKAAAADPGHAKAHYWLGLGLEHRRLLREAVREFRRARELRPDDPKVLLALAQTLNESGLWDESAVVFREFLAARPEDSAAHLGLARVEAMRHRLEEGLSEARRAARLDPSNPDAWLLVATFAIDSRRPAEAEEALRNAEMQAGGDPAPIGFAWALLERSRARPDAADVRLKQVLTRNPDFEPASRLLLQNAAEQGKRGEAEAFLRGLTAKGTGSR